jgi:hypothetical protein
MAKAKPAEKARYIVVIDKLHLDDGTTLLRDQPYEGEDAETYLASGWIERV